MKIILAYSFFVCITFFNILFLTYGIFLFLFEPNSQVFLKFMLGAFLLSLSISGVVIFYNREKFK